MGCDFATLEKRPGWNVSNGGAIIYHYYKSFHNAIDEVNLL